MEGQQTRENLANAATWKRGGFTLLFLVFGKICGMMVGIITVYQFLTVLFTGKSNERLIPFCQSLAHYVLQVTQYCTFLTEQRPYPFDNWPQG